MIKLITAEEAREMREIGMNNFIEKDMEKYIEHINKLVREATSRGEWHIQVTMYEHPEYPQPVDKLLGKLSELKRMVLIDHLKENGYTPMVYANTFYLSWDISKEQEVKEKPIRPTAPERKPMTAKEIRKLGESFRNNRNPEKFIDFARAIEKHHGIGRNDD